MKNRAKPPAGEQVSDAVKRHETIHKNAKRRDFCLAIVDLLSEVGISETASSQHIFRYADRVEEIFAAGYAEYDGSRSYGTCWLASTSDEHVRSAARVILASLMDEVLSDK